MTQTVNREPMSSNGSAKTTPTVMAVGKSGAGKSTLCNYLLYGKPQPANGFRVSPGYDPVTFECQTMQVEKTPPPKRLIDALSCHTYSSGPLRTIDTPGIPDPNGRTLEFYDDIVRTARDATVLNAVIIVVNYTGDRDQIKREFDLYGILIKQFSKLPCYKILLCRHKMPPDLEQNQEDAEMKAVEDWTKELKKRAEIEETQTAFLRENDLMSTQIFSLRETLCNMPQTSISESNMRTYSELRYRVKTLTDEEGHRVEALQKHMAELRTERNQLQSQNAELDVKVLNTRKHSNIISALVIGGGMAIDICTGFVSFGSVTAGSIAAGRVVNSASKAYACIFETYIQTNKNRIEGIGTNIADIEYELKTDNRNEEALAKDQAELRQLEYIAHLEHVWCPVNY